MNDITNLEDKIDKFSEENSVMFLFTMPLGGILEIRSSAPVVIEGLTYKISWDGLAFPYHCENELQAMGIALGCQWAAKEMMKKFNDERNDSD